MKKTLLALFAMFVVSTAIVGQNAKDIVGKYTGDLYIQLFDPINEETEAIPNQRVEITAGSTERTVNFALYDFAFGDMKLGDILLSEISITKNDAIYSFGEKAAVRFDFPVEDNMSISASVALNPTGSYVHGDSLVANIDVIWHAGEVGGDVPIYVLFKGVRPASTGIGNLENVNTAGVEIYTLHGVRVTPQQGQKLPKGLYVVNGKKTFVK